MAATPARRRRRSDRVTPATSPEPEVQWGRSPFGEPTASGDGWSVKIVRDPNDPGSFRWILSRASRERFPSEQTARVAVEAVLRELGVVGS